VTIERYLRLIAGSFVLMSLLLGYFFSHYWFLFTGFVALNLIQSAFTDWCPMMALLKKLGAKSVAADLGPTVSRPGTNEPKWSSTDPRWLERW